MRKLKYLFIVFIAVLGSRFAASQNLSERTVVSIITCEPGNELYSTFGHSAIRVRDPLSRIDKVYNYGTFNFETPNFYLKFTRGQLDYMLTVSPFKYFVIAYMEEQRGIREQTLNLSPQQINDVYAFLENNALPENMYYRYDFSFDNCATRVKDVFKNVLKNDLILPESAKDEGKSFKEMLKPYLKGKDWERFGIHLCLGQPANEIASTEQTTFLPDYLEKVIDNSKVVIYNEEMPLVKEKRVLYFPRNKIVAKSGVFSPFPVFSVILLIVLIFTYLELKKNRYYLMLDKTLFFIFGLLGFTILLVWFGTEHKAVVNNWNVLWAMPLYLFAAFLVKRSGNKSYLRYFMLIMSVILALSLILDLAFYDVIDFAATPIIIALGLRSYLIFSKRR
jgi:hypothetical protein